MHYCPAPDPEGKLAQSAGIQTGGPITITNKPISATYLFRFLVLGSLRYARSCVKNCVKVLIGLEPSFSFQNSFFRQYLRQLLGLQRINKITCVSPFSREGAGSQALFIMRAINFARICGLTYVHTPFHEIRHADRSMQEWVDAWEANFNFGVGEVATDGDNSQVVNFVYNFSELLSLFGVSIGDLTCTFEATIPEFRRKYYSNKCYRKRNEVLTVGVHVRRGDITSSRPEMWTSTSFVAETIAHVRALLDAHCIKYKICVFSQEDCANLAELDLPDTEFFCNADPIWSMQEAIEADILIMAKSCFSYVAALISSGIKVYEPFFFPPLTSWVIRGPKDEFDCRGFERQLLQHIDRNHA